MGIHSNHPSSQNAEIKLAESLAVLRAAAATTEAAMGQAQLTLAGLDDVIDRKSPTAFRMSRMMGDVSHAARAIRALADHLEKNPGSLVFEKE